jgi:hypothetical protein
MSSLGTALCATLAGLLAAQYYFTLLEPREAGALYLAAFVIRGEIVFPCFT